MIIDAEAIHHRKPACFRARFAFGLVKFMRFFADAFFAKRYGHRGVVLDEADNERMHLMTFIKIARPSRLEQLLIVLAQGAFYNLFFLLYVFSPRTAHRIVGYLEEEAVYGYAEYLAGIDDGTDPNVPAPQFAIDNWGFCHPAPCWTMSSS